MAKVNRAGQASDASAEAPEVVALADGTVSHFQPHEATESEATKPAPGSAADKGDKPASGSNAASVMTMTGDAEVVRGGKPAPNNKIEKKKD